MTNQDMRMLTASAAYRSETAAQIALMQKETVDDRRC
jgi:hypothetical protein